MVEVDAGGIHPCDGCLMDGHNVAVLVKAESEILRVHPTLSNLRPA